MNRILCIALFVAIFSITAALADPPEVNVLEDIQPTYIAIGASGVSSLYMDNGVAVILAEGDTNFTITVSESYSGDIDNCWVYFDGDSTLLSSTSIVLNMVDLRTHYGCVAIEYDDDTFEYAAFTVDPWWDLQAIVSAGASAPSASIWSLPTDVDSVFTDVNGIEPNGPPVVMTRKVCTVISSVSPSCDPSQTSYGRTCTVDNDCKNQE